LNLQDLSNIAQVLGAVAVVVSLFYVGSQIRQNTAAVRSSTAQAVHDNYASWYISLASNGELMKVSVDGLRSYSTLPEVEKARVLTIMMAFLSFSQNAFYQWREGSLLPQLWVSWEALMINLVQSPGGQELWAERAYVFGDEFRSHVENVIMKRTPDPKAKPFGAFQLN